MPQKIQQIFDEVMKESRNEIKEITGCYFDPFIQKYPIEVDIKELERIKRQEIAKKRSLILKRKLKQQFNYLNLKMM